MPVSDDALSDFLAAAAEPAVDREGSTNTTLAIVAFRVGSRWLGAHVSSVREVATRERITPVPSAPRHVLGVTLIHGRLVPVISVAELIPSQGDSGTARMAPRLIVLEADDTEVAVAADETFGVVHLSHAAEHREAATDDRPDCVIDELRWGDRLIAVLGVSELLESTVAGDG